MRKLPDIRWLVPALVLCFAAGCGEEESLGADEPFRARNAQFFEGELPGAPAGAQPPEGRPVVTSIELQNPITVPGQAQKSIRGRVTEDAFSVGVRLKDFGSGYWVVPIGSSEPQNPGESVWSLSADISASLPSGPITLVAVAFDAEGRPGVQRETTLCIASRIPDNGAACLPGRELPEVVFVLEWSADTDVDLEVLTPEGRLITPKKPLVNQPGGSPAAPAADEARILADSVGACVPDGFRQESLVFQKRPPRGSKWQIFANLFDSCGVDSVSFELTVFEPRGAGDERKLVPVFSRSGLLGARDETGGSDTGLLLVRDYKF